MIEQTKPARASSPYEVPELWAESVCGDCCTFVFSCCKVRPANSPACSKFYSKSGYSGRTATSSMTDAQLDAMTEAQDAADCGGL